MRDMKYVITIHLLAFAVCFRLSNALSLLVCMSTSSAAAKSSRRSSSSSSLAQKSATTADAAATSQSASAELQSLRAVKTSVHSLNLMLASVLADLEEYRQNLRQLAATNENWSIFFSNNN